MNNRITSIDYAKVLAIICVVMGHILYFDIYGQHTECSPLFKFIYSFHMPLFFFLSGLVVSFTPQRLCDAFSDLEKRFLQLIMPMLVIGSVLTLVSGENVSSVLTSDMKSGYWYLEVLFFYYVIVRLFEFFFFKIKAISGGQGTMMTLIVALFVIWQLLLRGYHYLPKNIVSVFSLVQIQLYLPYFAAGVVMNNCKGVFHNQWLLIGASIVWCMSTMFQFHYMLHVVCVLASVFSLMCICVICDRHEGQIKKLMCYLGRNTLYIYCFHYFMIHLMDFSFVGDWLKGYQNIVLEIIACVIPTILAIIGPLFMKEVVLSSSFLSRLVFNKK